MLEMADPTPTMKSSDRAALIAFVTSQSEGLTVVPVEHPDQLCLRSDMTTVAGRLRYTWPALSVLCSQMARGSRGLINTLCGRNTTTEANLEAARDVYNTVVTARFRQISSRFLLVDPGGRIVRPAGEKRARHLMTLGSQLDEVLTASVDTGGLEFLTGYFDGSFVDVAFGFPGLSGQVRGAQVRPVSVVSPRPERRKSVSHRLGLGVDLGFMVYGRSPHEPGRSKNDFELIDRAKWAASAPESLRELLAESTEVLTALADAPLVGIDKESLRRSLQPFLRSQGVLGRIAAPCIQRLVYGRFGPSPDLLAEAEARTTGQVHRTAFDLVRSIAAELTATPVVQYAVRLSNLSRLGFALATGRVSPPTATTSTKSKGKG